MGTSRKFSSKVKKIKMQGNMYLTTSTNAISSDMNVQLAHSTKTMSTVSHETTMQPSVSMPLCQPVFSPVINSSGNGTVNFTVNIYP